MALVDCQDCGQKISTDVKRCPACGAKQRMPYRARLFIAGLVCFILYAVFSNHGPIPPQKSSAMTNVQSAPVNRYLSLPPADLIKQAEELDRRWIPAGRPMDNNAQAAAIDQEVDDAREALLSVREVDPLQRRAKALVARFDKRQVDASALAALAARKEFASRTEERMLSKGMSTTVTAEGTDAKTLRVKYALVSKAFAYQVGNQTDFVNTAYALGFKRVILDDGFGERYVYTAGK